MPTKAKAKSSNRPVTAGVTLILIGGIFLADRANLFEFHWPLILIAAGVLFLVQAIHDKNLPSEIFVVSLLITIGLVFYAERATPWFHGGLADAWPFLMVAIGLSYLLSAAFNKSRGFLISGVVFIALGVFFLLVVYEYILWSDIGGALTWWPVILIGLGVYLLLSRK